MDTLRIATRRSALALWQSEHVASLLRVAHTGLQVELVPMSTQGDEILDTPLAAVGGKGLFTHELERAMVDGRADIAVHSLKDVPAALPAGMSLAAMLERADPSDAFVCNMDLRLEDLAEGARIGTSSLRRQCQLTHRYPGLVFAPLRGNVHTRLARLDAGELEALVLASAGLTRLGLQARIRQRIPAEVCLPAIGQGTLAIECPEDSGRVLALVRVLDDRDTRARCEAERAVNRHLGGDCHAPIAAFAELLAGRLHLRARVGSHDGATLLEVTRDGSRDDPQALGTAVAESLLAQGAGALLDHRVPT